MADSQERAAWEWNEGTRCTAFDGVRRIASGTLREVAGKTKEVMDRRGDRASVLIFDDATGWQIEVDFRGSVAQVLARLPKEKAPGGEADQESAARGPGRPKLGVVAREVTLLPRHWEWLNEQPGGASVALRRLVEVARRTGAEAHRKRHSQEAAYRFMSALAGDRAGYEEATRALFAGDAAGFERRTAEWPADVRGYARALARVALGE